VSNNIPADECGKATITFFDKTGHVLWQKTNESLYILECNVSDDGERTLLFLECFQDNRFFCVCNKKGQEISKIENPTMVFPNLDNTIIYYTQLNENTIGCINYEKDTSWTFKPECTQIRTLITGKYLLIINDRFLTVYNSMGKELWTDKGVYGIFTYSENDDKTLIWHDDNAVLYDNSNGKKLFNLSGLKYKDQLYRIYSATFFSNSNVIVLSSWYDANNTVLALVNFKGKILHNSMLNVGTQDIKQVQFTEEHILTVTFRDNKTITQKIDINK